MRVKRSPRRSASKKASRVVITVWKLQGKLWGQTVEKGRNNEQSEESWGISCKKQPGPTRPAAPTNHSRLHNLVAKWRTVAVASQNRASLFSAAHFTCLRAIHVVPVDPAPPSRQVMLRRRLDSLPNWGSYQAGFFPVNAKSSTLSHANRSCSNFLEHPCFDPVFTPCPFSFNLFILKNEFPVSLART